MTTGESIPNSREQRGIELFRKKGSEIEWHIDGTFSVPSSATSSATQEVITYDVDLRVGDAGVCTCTDFQTRRNTCKHIYAATIKKAHVLAQKRKEAAERKERAEKRELIKYTPEEADKLIAGLDRMIS